MTKKIEKGRRGEALATSFFLEKGYELVGKNLRFSKAEIDLIVIGKGVLVFVEVKYRKETSFGHPEEMVSAQQMDKLREGAEDFLDSYPWEGPIRFDILSLSGDLENAHLDWFEDAF